MIFNKQKIKENFNRASSSYNKNATLQKIVAKNLFKLAKNDVESANNILDLGSGSGFICQNILENFPDKEITQLDIADEMLDKNPYPTKKIVGDIENLPFKSESFDLVLSSLAMQWINDLQGSVQSILKILKPKKNLHFSIIGSETLKELKTSAKECGINLSINDFSTENDLKNLGRNIHVSSEIIKIDYKDCYELMHRVKSIGASYNKNNQIITKNQFDNLNNFYLKNFIAKGRVIATWQVFYVSIINE